jgi:hypothetical protein
MKTLRRKLRQIWAVLKWDDAIVYREKGLNNFVLGLMPSVYGLNSLPMTCQVCGARWNAVGPMDNSQGHHGFCPGHRITEFVKKAA